MNSKEFWISKNLTEKAAIVLADLGIDTFEDLVGSIINEDFLRQTRNCAEGTSYEIINFRRRLLPTTDTSHKKINRRAVAILKKIRVNEIPWDSRTMPLIRESRAKSIYDLAMINLPVYQDFNHYNLRAYHKIKSKVFEILTELNTSSSAAHEDEEISLNIFIEKPAQEKRKEKRDKNKEIAEDGNNARVPLFVKNERRKTAQYVNLQRVAGIIFKNMSPEESYIIKVFYGFNDRPRTCKQIASLIQLSEEEVKTIKEQADQAFKNNPRTRKLHRQLAHLYQPWIRDLLKKHNNKISLPALKKALLEKTAPSHKDKAIFSWLIDMWGPKWFYSDVIKK